LQSGKAISSNLVGLIGKVLLKGLARELARVWPLRGADRKLLGIAVYDFRVVQEERAGHDGEVLTVNWNWGGRPENLPRSTREASYSSSGGRRSLNRFIRTRERGFGRADHVVRQERGVETMHIRRAMILNEPEKGRASQFGTAESDEK